MLFVVCSKQYLIIVNQLISMVTKLEKLLKSTMFFSKYDSRDTGNFQ
jgi:hypothetical protein